MATIVGIDISKGWFDAAWRRAGDLTQARFSRDDAGLKELLERTPEDSHYVMEATGSYHLRVALFCHQAGRAVSVINPLVIRRYAQMNLMRAKTDAVDARLITDFGEQKPPTLWGPPAAVVVELAQTDSWLEDLMRQHSRLLNQQEALVESSCASAFVLKQQAAQRSRLKKQIEGCERRLETLVKGHFKAIYERLLSVPGIGPRTATALITVTRGFTRFEEVESLVAFTGLCPRVSTSGTSVKGRGAIAKMGAGRLRQLLYLCSWTAQTVNRACAALSKRLAEKGKPKRVIKIAIAHKLLRQAFAVAKKGECYSDSFA